MKSPEQIMQAFSDLSDIATGKTPSTMDAGELAVIRAMSLPLAWVLGLPDGGDFFEATLQQVELESRRCLGGDAATHVTAGLSGVICDGCGDRIPADDAIDDGDQVYCPGCALEAASADKALEV